MVHCLWHISLFMIHCLWHVTVYDSLFMVHFTVYDSLFMAYFTVYDTFHCLWSTVYDGNSFWKKKVKRIGKAKTIGRYKLSPCIRRRYLKLTHCVRDHVHPCDNHAKFELDLMRIGPEIFRRRDLTIRARWRRKVQWRSSCKASKISPT